MALPGPSRQAKAIILPHAGYLYSGKTAGEVMRRTQIPETCFLIGPNHWGYGHPFAIVSAGSWETPLGAVEIDHNFASGLLEACHDLRKDDGAHEKEHSLEVEVPFLQYRNPQVKIVPLVIGTLDWDRSREVALALTEFLKTRRGVLIVASTDMNHYESDEATRKKDRYALQAIEALDPEGLRKAITHQRITMCGAVPVYMALFLIHALGGKKAHLVDYRTSADASGDYDRVVGYAGFIIE